MRGDFFMKRAFNRFSVRSRLAPLSDRDIEEKRREGVRTGRSDWDADRVIGAVWRLDSADDVGYVLQSLRPPSAARQTTSN
ncbi:hypothetical protein [Bradyrhizobium tropiciagri]|uniref:hypothetical protein n=1 Tax=Bradyrhizobium tropiciagri TaxID=312253 RepID=UPI002010FD0F|nr:hypothetical protein [Bradyrhizobium tropiciagri]